MADTNASSPMPLPAPRIALLLPKFSHYGGVEQFAYRLSKALADRGYRVAFICGRQETPAPAGVRIICVGRPRFCKAFKLGWFLLRAEQILAEAEFDFVLSLGKTWDQDMSRVGGGPLKIFWEKSERALRSSPARILKKIRRRLSPANWLTLFVEKRQFNRHSQVIAVSHLVRDWLLASYPALDPGNIHVVYNKPDLEEFAPPQPEQRARARAALAAACGLDDFSAAPTLIGTASTNFALKGVAPLIQALALLPGDCRLMIAGGRNAKAYHALANRLGVGGRVHFLGKVENMPEFYKALDVFILPTYYDACSNAVLEALASGCKTITTGSNGAAYFLPPEAVLDDPGDAVKMAERLRAFIAMPQPAPFIWPDDVQSGLDDFIAVLENAMARKKEQA